MEVVRRHWVEALAGLLVLVVAVWFTLFAFQRTASGVGRGADSYRLTARFTSAAGVGLGTDVRVAGLRVGRVSAQQLDPASWQAVLTLSLDGGVRLPQDTAAAISSEGLLGGSFIQLIPGGDPEPLADGDEIVDTQGATDLMGLIGSVINRPSGGEPAGDTP